MLKQDDVAFIKALTNVELSPVFLRELKKAMAAGKKKRPSRPLKLRAP
jgi:hypothetical protein